MGIARVLPVDIAWVADYEPPARKKNGTWTKPTQGPARILARRYPGVPNLGDITKVDWAATAPVDIIAGGTPCQDVSHAGARAGMRTGTRSGIWSSMVTGPRRRPAPAGMEPML
jgi:DNA (cytosine-5)-methyltransferase 1